MDNPIAEAYIKMLQERNKKDKDAKLDDGDGMDPVGQGDADIDNDGDTDSSDEYLHKRRAAIKKSLKKEENEDVDEWVNIKKAVTRDSSGASPLRKKFNRVVGKSSGEKSADAAKRSEKIRQNSLAQIQRGLMTMKKKKKVNASYNEELDSSASHEELDVALIAQIFAEAKGRKLSPDDIRKALAADKAKAKDKSKVSLRKTPWDKFKEAVEIETDADKTDVEDPKAKKKAPEKKTGKGDPAAVNAPSQDDRAAIADKPDPSEDPDAEPTPPKEKEAPAPKEKEKIVVKKKPVDKEESVKKESFDWDEISEMNDEQVDAFIDSLDESQLDSFEAEMNSLVEAANPEGDAAQQDKEQGDFIAKHKKTIIDRPDADKPKAADATKPAAKRPGDKNDGDKSPVKRMKDIRK